jgi:hypothetical protein
MHRSSFAAKLLGKPRKKVKATLGLSQVGYVVRRMNPS